MKTLWYLCGCRYNWKGRRIYKCDDCNARTDRWRRLFGYIRKEEK